MFLNIHSSPTDARTQLKRKLLFEREKTEYNKQKNCQKYIVQMSLYNQQPEPEQ